MPAGVGSARDEALTSHATSSRLPESHGLTRSVIRPYRPSMSRRLSSTDAETWFAWIRERSGGEDGCTGFDAGGWEDSTWVLHSIFEQPGGDGSVTHDDVLRAALRSGDIVPRSDGERILHERCTTIEAGLVEIALEGARRTPGGRPQQQPIPAVLSLVPLLELARDSAPTQRRHAQPYVPRRTR